MAKREQTAEQKAKAVIELLQGERTISEIARSMDVTPRTVENWRKEFMENSSRAFTVGKDEKEARAERQEAEEREKALAEKVGRLTVELDWAKKKVAQAGINREKRTGRH